MERYRILDHPADGKFRAFGATLEEAFANAALACASFMWDWEKIEKRVEHRIALEGFDLSQLLIKFLGEIPYLLDVRSFLLGGVEDLKIEIPPDSAPAGASPLKLTARFLGDDRIDRYELFGDVKAITYNEMKIESCDCEGGGWTVQVVVDL